VRLKHQDAGEAAHPVNVSEALHRSRPPHGNVFSEIVIRFNMSAGSIWDAISLRYNLLFPFES
jgi:hypothetical protein